MNSLDIVLILLILFGAFKGWRGGAVTRLVSLIGTVVVFVLAFFLKNPISILLYTKLPFFNFSGIFTGISSFNIILYEFIAYLICLLILGLILAIILKLTGIIDRLIKLTIIFSIPDKIIGAMLGAIQYYFIGFVIAFVCSVIIPLQESLKDSTYAVSVLKNTPIVSNLTGDTYNSISEIYDICVVNKENSGTSRDKADYDSLEVLLKNHIISVDSVKKLNEKGKLNITEIGELITKYEKKND